MAPERAMNLDMFAAALAYRMPSSIPDAEAAQDA